MERKPETVRIAITDVNGRLWVMSFVTKEHGGVLMENGEISPGWEREPTPENIDAEIAQAEIAAVSWRIIDPSEILQDRTFRNAWADTGQVSVDMPKAREIQRNRIREVRAPMLAALDAQYMRADETGDTVEKARVAAEKQRLRNFTADPRIAAAPTPEVLKAILPVLENPSNGGR